MFSTPSIWKYWPFEATGAELQNDTDVCPHAYYACPKAEEAMIFPVSRNGRAMWSRPTASTSSTKWIDWVCKIDKDRSVARPLAKWKHILDVVGGNCAELLPCGHFGLKIRARLAKLIAGAWKPPVASARECGGVFRRGAGMPAISHRTTLCGRTESRRRFGDGGCRLFVSYE